MLGTTTHQTHQSSQQVAEYYQRCFKALADSHGTTQNDTDNDIPCSSVSFCGPKINLPFVEPHNTSAGAQYTIPLNQQPAVADKTAHLPVGDAVAEHVISLPMHPYLDKRSIQLIVQAIASAVTN